MNRFMLLLAIVVAAMTFFIGCDNGNSSSSTVTLATVSPAQLTVEAQGVKLPVPTLKGVQGEIVFPGQATPNRPPATVAPAVPHGGGAEGKVAKPIPTLAPRVIECDEGVPVHIQTADGEILGCSDPAAGSEEASH